MSSNFQRCLAEASMQEFRAALDRHRTYGFRLPPTACEVGEPLTPEQEAFLEIKRKLAKAGFKLTGDATSNVAVVTGSKPFDRVIGLASQLIGEQAAFHLQFPKGKQTLDFDTVEVTVGKGVPLAESLRQFEKKLAAFAAARCSGQIEPGLYVMPPDSLVRQFSNQDGSGVSTAFCARDKKAEAVPVILSMCTAQKQRVRLLYDKESRLVKLEISEFGDHYFLVRQNARGERFTDSRTGLLRWLRIDQATGDQPGRQAELSIIDFDEPRLSRLFSLSAEAVPMLVAQDYAGLFADVSFDRYVKQTPLAVRAHTQD
jgi:hypothetical protein